MEKEGKGTGEKEQGKRTEAGKLAGGENGCYNGQQKMRKDLGGRILYVIHHTSLL